MATGSVRFWFDAWHELAQVGGAPTNPLVTNAHCEDTLDPAAVGILWMQCRTWTLSTGPAVVRKNLKKIPVIRKNSRECCRYSTTITRAT